MLHPAQEKTASGVSLKMELVSQTCLSSQCLPDFDVTIANSLVLWFSVRRRMTEVPQNPASLPKTHQGPPHCSDILLRARGKKSAKSGLPHLLTQHCFANATTAAPTIRQPPPTLQNATSTLQDHNKKTQNCTNGHHPATTPTTA